MRAGCRLQQQPASQKAPPPTVAMLISAVLLAARLPHMWGTALGLLQLDIKSHLALYALLSTDLVIRVIPNFCSTSYINNPETLQRFWTISTYVNEWVGLLLPWQQPGSPPRAEGPAVRHCVAVVATTQLILGFFMSSVAVYVGERHSRADFLSLEVAARGLRPAEAGEQVGLPVQEVVETCMFDPLHEWLRWAMLVPPLAAATWLAVTTLTR